MTSHFNMHVNDGTPEGKRVKTECRRFSHYVGGVRFWFALHKVRTCNVISHVVSGKKVCDSQAGYTSMNYAKHDELAIARRSLDQLCEKVGADRVRCVLTTAEIPITNAADNTQRDAA